MLRFLFVSLLLTGPAFADCASVNTDAMAKFKALLAAKAAFEQEFLAEQKLEFGPASIDRVIISTTKVKMAMDASLENLLQAQAQKCFGKDAEKWAAVIPELQRQSEDLGRNREEYLAQQRMMQEVLKRKQRAN